MPFKILMFKRQYLTLARVKTVNQLQDKKRKHVGRKINTYLRPYFGHINENDLYENLYKMYP